LAVVLISLRNRSAPIDRRELRAQHLDRDFPVVLQVLGEIDRGHPAGAELPFNAVVLGDGDAEALNLELIHGLKSS